MVRVVVRSFLSLMAAALLGSLVVFVLLRFLGGDVVTVMLGLDAGSADAAELRAQLGLDQPYYVQYLSWLGGVVTGDLGTSYAAHYDVFEQIVIRMQPTALLAFGTLLISMPLALFLGTYSAINSKSARGVTIDTASQMGVAIPAFWAGLLLVLVFSLRLGILPTGGYVPFFEDPVNSVRHLILPVAALTLGTVSVFTRYVRSSMLEIMNEDFIRTARAKGRTRKRALVVHGIRNASVPLVTVATLQLGLLMAGVVVIENVFVIPGVGRLLVLATEGREVVVVQSLALVLILMVLTMNFLMDIAYGLIDPRIRDKRVRGS